MGFRGDERGQSEVIGALLIFAVIVAFIGLNQAFLVPQANEEIEFKHHNDVQRDVVDLRAATTEAAASSQPRSRTVALGTEYPTRFVAINPPPATGTIRTVDGDGEINATGVDLSAVCGTSGQPDTKFIEYRPNYNEYGNALPMTIENTVAYRDAGSQKLYSTGQVFAKGNQINIIRYVGDVQESSAGSASLDLIPSVTGADTIDTSNETLNITMPTQLSASEWGQLVDSSQVTPLNVSGDRVKFNFENDTVYTTRCTTVGINQEPNVDPQDSRDRDDTPNSINPNADGEVVLVSAEDLNGGSQSEANITLEDRTGLDVNITEARVNHYSSGSQANSASLPNSITLGGSDLEVGGNLETLDNAINLTSGTTTDVKLEFNGAEVSSEDFYVLTLGFSNEEFNIYFISHAKE